ncbi:hypothetical protein [Vibrio alginolyticus]|uniref:hypothetical protein n=1 Tax=Vibrio alginolyticus TaxID=663 RepID=UPI001303814C|nr:hypothetical protein [Vibrio alginolyticus]
MKAPERIKFRHKAKTKARQAMFRTRQREKGLALLQVRISRLAHAKACEQCEQCEQNGITLTELYQLAINNTDPNQLPEKHPEVIEGDLVGARQISPWIDPEVAETFEKLATNYRNRTIAMSAIVYAYCARCEAE